jgi:hypothetical protein
MRQSKDFSTSFSHQAFTRNDGAPALVHEVLQVFADRKATLVVNGVSNRLAHLLQVATALERVSVKHGMHC